MEYEQALKIHRRLAQKNPESHIPDVSGQRTGGIERVISPLLPTAIGWQPIIWQSAQQRL
jgi:hypothetical protein